MNKLISLCMIVKDEAAHLPRCLESVKGAVDEIIVVDTGSTDHTVTIARRRGARVIQTVWQDDFAHARNLGVEQAQGKWILFLDADEELDGAAQKLLRQIAQHEEYDGFFLKIVNYVGNGSQGATVNPVLRMFRNKPAHRFTGRIHEQIAESICKQNPRAAFHITDAIIHHYGYQPERVTAKDKVTRNMTLLQKAIAQEPENAFFHYNLGVEHVRTANTEEALRAFCTAKALIDPRITSYAHLLYKYEIKCRQALGDWEMALCMTEQALALFPAYTDLFHCKALCESALGKPQAAKASLAYAIKLGPPPAFYHTEEGIGTYQTAYLLGKLEEESGEIDAAISWYLESVRMNASVTPPLYRLFHLLRISGHEQHIPAFIDQYLTFSSPEAVWKVVEILLQCRCGRAVLDFLHGKEGEWLAKHRRDIALLYAELQGGNLASARARLHDERREATAKTVGQQAQDTDDVWTTHEALLSWLENGQESNPIATVPASNQEWGVWQAVLEAAEAAGRHDRFQHMLQTWGSMLAQAKAENRISGTRALVRGLSAVADRHLSRLGYMPGHKAVYATRIRLPVEEGFS